MRHHSPRSTSKHCGHQVAFTGEQPVSDAVDALVHSMKSPSYNPLVENLDAEAKALLHLPKGH